jgi:alpha-galactosidase
LIEQRVPLNRGPQRRNGVIESEPDTSPRSGACYIELVGDRLMAGNEAFARSWRVAPDGGLIAESFRCLRTGTEWLAASTPNADPSAEASQMTLVPAVGPSPVEADSLTANLTVAGADMTVTWTLQVFPGASGVRMRRSGGPTPAAVADNPARAVSTGVEQDVPAMPAASRQSGEDSDVLESLTLAPLHLRLTQVLLQDQTDIHSELVSEREWLLHPSERLLSLPGCLFYVEDVLTGAGLIFLKEAPLPAARPVPSPHDFQVRAAERRFTLAGHGAGEDGVGYAFVTLTYDGGMAGRIAALQQYQRCLRPYVPGRDGMLVSNTWGDRNRDGRINAAFLAREIEAGARLGVDVVQIDDGWQVGATSNSVRAKERGGVWEGFYASRDNFWAVSPERFPHGLEPLVAAAREKGMRFGLWFGPDSANDFAHAERDADTILRLHRDLGIAYIKIDGVKLRSKTGERNLYSFFDRVLTESGGSIVFDLDVTAETRPGYFGFVRSGPLFVENRYTDWRKYWPHQTLRNLWKLAHYVDPARLRMEWLNHARNTEKYADDPLAPGAYRPDYLFATVMFSSPLGWFEVSNLPESYFTEAAPLIVVWKAHRDAIFGGTVLPIGDAPDGRAWTGFVSVAPDGRSAYLLVFREASPHAEWRAVLPVLPTSPLESALAFERLGGDGSAEWRGGELRVTIPESHRFFFGRITL